MMTATPRQQRPLSAFKQISVFTHYDDDDDSNFMSRNSFALTQRTQNNAKDSMELYNVHDEAQFYALLNCICS